MYALDKWKWISNVISGLQHANSLQPIDMSPQDAIVPIGNLVRRGLTVPVVWIREPISYLDDICRRLRLKMQGDGLIVILLPYMQEQAPVLVDPQIVRLVPPKNQTGDLALWRAFDLLDPSYSTRRIKDPWAVFDKMHIRFATVPGVRHIVEINGHEIHGFQKSDLKFLKMFRMASARHNEFDVEKGGCLRKARLHCDVKGKEIGGLRDALRMCNHPDFDEDELAALIKSTPDRKVRLAIYSYQISFDESLADFQFLLQQNESLKKTKGKSPGAKELVRHLWQSIRMWQGLLYEARELMVPSPR